MQPSTEVALPGLGAVAGGRTLTEGEPFACENPADWSVLCELPASSPAVVDAAVAAARAAFEGAWATTSPGRRQRMLTRLAALVDEHADELARLESVENGVPITVVRRFSVAALAKNLSYFAGWIDKLFGDVVPLTGGAAIDYATREPFGVVAVLTAYNTPSLFLGSKLGPALATGNTVVVKPSPLASLPALRLVELAAEAGVPDGVINVVLGGAETGRHLVGHAGVDMVSFTGSRAAGADVAGRAAEHCTPVSLELGGKSPDIVFADADIGRAAGGATLGAFALSGQACVAGSRVFAERSVEDELTERLVATATALPLGDPAAPTTLLGPLITAAQRERVEAALARAVDAGAKVLCGGDRPEGDLAAGHFLRPAVVTGVDDTSELACEELFGPVVVVMAFDDEDEVVRRANATPYGLAAGVWTRDLARAHRVAGALRAGSVWVNSYGNVPHTAPFGGFKQSGYGRDGGRWAMEQYTQVKNVYVDLS